MKKKSFAFTLAEALIVLAVLGVIAAMTIPSLVQDYQKKATVTKVQKVYSTLNQAITTSTAENGPMSDFLAAHPTRDANTTKEFFDTYWLPYFRVQKVADNGKTFYNRNYPYLYLSGQTQGNAGIMTSYANDWLLFSDVSGMIYLITIGGTVYVDINGTSGPNTFGKDVFYFIVDYSNSVVNPQCHNLSKGSINRNCSSSSYGQCCAAKIKMDGWKIADDYPW